MCNFNKQNDETKALISLLMAKSADTIGGANSLLGLIEALRATKPHPLTTNKCYVGSDKVSVKWNKIIFKDKLMVLEDVLLGHKSSENPDFNILETNSDKKRKKIINMAKTLAPIEFIVTPKDSEEGAGFNFKIFEKIEDDCVTLNPLFVAIFFCSVEFTKKALKHS